MVAGKTAVHHPPPTIHHSPFVGCIMDPYLLGFLGFLVVAGAIGLVAYALRDTDQSKAAERLDNLVGRGGKGRDSQSDMLLKQQLVDVDRKTLLDAITPEFLNMKKIFEQADANIKPSALFGISLGLALGGGMIGSLIAGSIYVAPVGGLLFFSVPWLWLFHKRKSRLKRFASQLPDAMELVARALRAGHSLSAGMHVVSEEMPPPICKEFGRVYEEQNLGVSLEDALKNM